MNLDDFRLTDMTIEADNGFYLVDVNGIVSENIGMKTKSINAINIFNAKNIKLKNVNLNTDYLILSY